MSIGSRIRELREQKGLSQGDVEKATGMHRCYISRVENGHTVPSLETLERFAAGFAVPLYLLFYAGENPPATPKLTPRLTLEELAEKGGPKSAEARFLLKLHSLLGKLSDPDRDVLLALARKFATRP